MGQRPEVEQSRMNIKSKEVLLVGIKNSLKPNLQAFAELTNNGLTGSSHRVWLRLPVARVIWPADMATCWRKFPAATFPTIRPASP